MTHQHRNDLLHKKCLRILECFERRMACPVCQEVIVEKVVLGCGHRFCSWCISRCNKVNIQCPICHTFDGIKGKQQIVHLKTNAAFLNLVSILTDRNHSDRDIAADEENNNAIIIPAGEPESTKSCGRRGNRAGAVNTNDQTKGKRTPKADRQAMDKMVCLGCSKKTRIILSSETSSTRIKGVKIRKYGAWKMRRLPRRTFSNVCCTGIAFFILCILHFLYFDFEYQDPEPEFPYLQGTDVLIFIQAIAIFCFVYSLVTNSSC